MKETLEVIYSPNVVTRMLSEKAASGAVRSHFVIDSTLNAIITSKVFGIEGIDPNQQNSCISDIVSVANDVSH